MQPKDFDAVMHIAARVHSHLPEARAVFANKLSLHPGGALVLESGQGPASYSFAHPWHCTKPPQLGYVRHDSPGRRRCTCMTWPYYRPRTAPGPARRPPRSSWRELHC